MPTTLPRAQTEDQRFRYERAGGRTSFPNQDPLWHKIASAYWSASGRPLTGRLLGRMSRDRHFYAHLMSRGLRVDYFSGGTRLTAWASGAGPPLVLLHGSGLQDHSSLAPWAEALAGGGRVYVCDVRGFGRSVSRSPASHTWDQYAADVVALLDHLRLPTAVVGGWSFGSGVALGTALRHPGRVAGLVIAEPGYAGAETGQTAAQRPVWAAGRELVARARTEGLLAAVLPGDAAPRQVELVRREVRRHDEQSFLVAHEGELQTAQPFNSLQQLAGVEVPVLLLPGCDDGHDEQISTWYAGHLPSVTVGPPAHAETSVVAASIKAFLRNVPHDSE